MVKRVIHTILLATILLLPLTLVSQSSSGAKKPKIPPKKTSTTKPTPSPKSSATKPNGSKKSSASSSGSASKSSQASLKRQRELEAQRQKQQRQRELETQRQEQQRQRELEAQRQEQQRELEAQRQEQQRELEAQRQEQQRVIQNLIDNMVYVEGGTFKMGATKEQKKDAYSWEKPVHQVTLSSFSIGKYEVTQAEWQAVMGSNPSHFKGDSRRPVENVSWNDCQEFIRKLNAMTGKRFRLPTEAEWEYAARGGTRSQGYKYAGSNIIDDVAWFYDNSGSTSHPVGTKSPNELGLYDMSGNVWEWCQDRYGSYNGNSQYNPTGPNSGSYRVYRGGSWDHSAWICRASYRHYGTTSDMGSGFGLRLAL